MSALQKLHHAIRTNPRLGRMAIRAIPDIPLGVNVRHIGPMKINLRTNRSYWLRDPVEGEKFILGAM
jgi:hypothetical protein